MPRRNTSRGNELVNRSPLVEWAKAALITALVMGTLWILLFTTPSLFGSNDAVWYGFYLALMLPGTFITSPFILVQGHSAWTVWFVIGGVLNWLFYSQLVYLFIRFRRREREAGLPPPEPERVDYSDRWQKPAPGSKV